MTNNAIKLSYDHVLFFGRTLPEYEAMFAINILQWKRSKILDCASGPSSFVAEARQNGVYAFGCDPLYQGDLKQLTVAGKTDFDLFITTKQSAADLFDHKLLEDPNQYRQKRIGALNLFLQDYSQKHNDGRYFAGSLPSIPYPDGFFDLVLSANFLFLYSDLKSGGCLVETTFDYEFHRQAILELYRLCSKEVRIYPIKGPNAAEHSYLAKLLQDLEQEGIAASIQSVPYRGVVGAEQMLFLAK